MRLLFESYFLPKSIIKRLKNRKISFLSLFDRASEIHQLAKINRFSLIKNSFIDAFSYVGPNSTLINSRVGKFCSISKNVSIGAYLHPTDFLSTNPIFYRKYNGTGTTWVQGNFFNDESPITTIGHDVWIGMNVTIMGGINVGDGAIIAAHAVVTKDVPPYAIVAGVPAKVVKFRFESDAIEKLSAIKWWDFPILKLKCSTDFFTRPVDDDLIRGFQNKFKE